LYDSGVKIARRSRQVAKLRSTLIGFAEKRLRYKAELEGFRPAPIKRTPWRSELHNNVKAKSCYVYAWTLLVKP
jgi:hypothetical protein